MSPEPKRFWSGSFWEIAPVALAVVALGIAWLLRPMPIFGSAGHQSPITTDSPFGVVLTNHGAGTGTIRTITYSFNGKPVNSFEDLVRQFTQRYNGLVVYPTNGVGLSLAPGESLWLIEIPASTISAYNPKPDAYGATGCFFPVLGEVEMTIQYASLYGDIGTTIVAEAKGNDASTKAKCKL